MNKWQKLHEQYAANAFQGNGHAYTQEAKIAELERLVGQTHPARRFVVERTLAWLPRCRAILVRYDKRADRYLATVKLASALRWFRRWHTLSQKYSQYL